MSDYASSADPSRPPLVWEVAQTFTDGEVICTVKTATTDRGVLYSVSVGRTRKDGTGAPYLNVRAFFEDGIVRTDLYRAADLITQADQWISETETARRAANPRPPPRRDFGGGGGGDRGGGGGGKGKRSGGGGKARQDHRRPDRLSED